MKRRLRILLAEDSLISRKIAVRIIETCGCEVEAAGTGTEALEKALAAQYDLILLDMFMPEMNGGDAAAELRKKGVKLPIVALSANQVAPEELSRYGMDDSIVKPVSSSELRKIITRFCGPDALDEVVQPGASSAGGDPVFDEAGALEFAGGSRTVLMEMITMYIDSTGKNIDGISAQLERYDLEKAKSAAHLVKGESKSLGVKKFYSAAAEIEAAAKAGDRGKCLSLTDEIRRHFSEFIEMLGAIRK